MLSFDTSKDMNCSRIHNFINVCVSCEETEFNILNCLQEINQLYFIPNAYCFTCFFKSSELIIPIGPIDLKELVFFPFSLFGHVSRSNLYDLNTQKALNFFLKHCFYIHYQSQILIHKIFQRFSPSVHL